MKTKTKATGKVTLPKIVSQAEWEKSRAALLKKEKAHTRAGDALAAQRRRLPMVKIEKDYIFDAPGKKKVRLLDMFEGRKQLILYHFMFAPSVGGWPKAGCPGCTLCMDQISHLAHLHARGVSFCMVSLAPLPTLLAYRRRMGWDIPWYSSAHNDFNKDFGRSSPKGEMFGLSVFIQDKGNIYRTYFTVNRGVESLGTVWSLLDVTPFGRQETWEDSPKGTPQTPPFIWWRRHDEYDA